MGGINSRGKRGFTLIELLAVMAIIGILAAIIVPAVSGTGDTSKDAQAQQDGSSLDSAAGDFFDDQTGAEVLSSNTVTVTATINGDATTGKTQQVSSRWPEVFITNGTSSAAYVVEFPISQGATVAAVVITDLDGAAISRTTLLEGYTALDFSALVDGGFLQKTPDGAESLSNDTFHNFLWLMRKYTSSGGSGENDSRKVTVFKLVSAIVNESTSKVTLTYEQIF